VRIFRSVSGDKLLDISSASSAESSQERNERAQSVGQYSFRLSLHGMLFLGVELSTVELWATLTLLACEQVSLNCISAKYGSHFL